MNTIIHPPISEQELLARAYDLAGKTVEQLAAHIKINVPNNFKRHKGFIGQLIESLLGANAQNLSLPDFVDLGIELKTIPIDMAGNPLESTFVSKAKIPAIETDFWQSRVWNKLKKVLIVPYLAEPNIKITERKIAAPILWSPSQEIIKQLKTDFDELTELMLFGKYTELNAKHGKFLQVRPKAANSKDLIQVTDNNNNKIFITPKGFYLRASFTKKIIQENYLRK